MADPIGLEALESDIQGEGLSLFAALPAAALGGLPPALEDCTDQVMILVGNLGSGFWPSFKASSEARDGLPDPMDRWSVRIGTAMAQRWHGRALFPFQGPPYLPFQQWAARAARFRRSPLGLLIHDEFGLWHAFRFALLLPGRHGASEGAATQFDDRRRGEPAAIPDSDLCLQCDGKPCLSACPVDAFTGAQYRVDACMAHLQTPQGQDCMDGGCRARLACPIAASWRYETEHAAFHMRAFVDSRRERTR